MVQIISFVTAAALLSQAVFAAPLDRRSQHEYGGNDVQSAEFSIETINVNSNNRYENDRNKYDSEYNKNYNQNEDYNKNYNQAEDYNKNYNQNSEYNQDYNQESEYRNQESEYRQNYNEEESTTRVLEHETQYREEETSTRAYETTSSYYSLPTYGSGSSNWQDGYNDCVSQCQAQFGNGKNNEYQNSLSNEDKPPSGAVHTVLVAPDGIGLRYMPFAVNASVGDTIRYVWTTPNNHTATLSSELAICNKSGIAEQRNFVSGVRNASVERQIFDVVVQTEDPQFFYCSVKTHCQQGMWGIINPKSGGNNTVGSMLQSITQNSPDLQSSWDYISQNVAGTSAENWGYNINLGDIPEDQYSQVAANVMFTQLQFAANPGSLETNAGAATPDGSPLQIVPIANTLLSNSNADPNVSGAPNGTRTGAAPTATDLQVVPLGSGAGRNVGVVGIWVAGLAGVVSWLLL